MTRFKAYARSAGVWLDCDFEALPDPSGVECVVALPDRAAVLAYNNRYGWTAVYFHRDGSIDYLDPLPADLKAAYARLNG